MQAIQFEDFSYHYPKTGTGLDRVSLSIPYGSFTVLTGANGGANVFYLYAERVEDGSTDGGNVIAQMVPVRFMSLGTERTAKGQIEDFTNALAGVMCKRPWAVVRRSGL